jgi:RND family efflux transporter MFP subunit
MSLNPVVRRWSPYLTAVASLLLASPGCRNGSGGPPPGGVPVKIETARAISIDDTTEYVATLRSRDSAVIMPQVEGHITKIFVHAGNRVAEGTPLMQIDPSKQQATVKSQEDSQASKRAALAYAKQQYERLAKLSETGIVSQQDLDQAKAALDAADADLRSATAQVREQEAELKYYDVTAPASGTVGDIPVRVGDRVTVSTVLTTVDGGGGLEAYVPVPVERAPQLKLGLPIRIVDAAGATVAESKLAFVSPEVDPQTQTVLAKARIEDPKGALRHAQFIRARVVWGTREGPLVPVLAVSRLSGQYFAFVAESEKGGLVARQKPLRLGSIVGNDYFVFEGIKPGDRMIVSGTQFISDGSPVSPQKQEGT